MPVMSPSSVAGWVAVAVPARLAEASCMGPRWGVLNMCLPITLMPFVIGTRPILRCQGTILPAMRRADPIVTVLFAVVPEVAPGRISRAPS